MIDGIILALTIPVIGTTAGAALVYTLKKRMPPRLNLLFMGFTAGVMIAAAVWSLLDPAMEMTGKTGLPKILPAMIGFTLGVTCMLGIDHLFPHQHTTDGTEEGMMKNKLSRTWKLVIAIIIHNIPEGIAIGIALAAVIEGNNYLSIAGATALSLGIAIQNIPEGAIVSIPLRDAGNTKNKAFIIGILSGIVQPIFALLTILLASHLVPIMPELLAFAAGAMIYVVVEELIPASTDGHHNNLGPIGFSIGFLLMILLDTLLG